MFKISKEKLKLKKKKNLTSLKLELVCKNILLVKIKCLRNNQIYGISHYIQV